MRTESGTVSAIAGILKAPLDIIADKLRGYLGLLDDLQTQPKKVLAACEALAPHLCNVAMGSSDPTGTVPVGFWMHRSCVPFVSPDTFKNYFWATLKPIILELWRHGRQTLFYAEGNWNHHLDSFAELPDRSIVYHVDQADIFEVHRKLGHKFCLSGGVPNVALSWGTPDQVRDHVKQIIDGVAQDGGYILDASAIMQNDTNPDNMRAMTDFAREYGVYSDGASTPAATPEPERPASGIDNPDWARSRVAPGVCESWEEQKAKLPPIEAREDLVQSVWESIDGLGNMFIWQMLLSF
jgi:uroporphyrinogen-III decarboxylase